MNAAPQPQANTLTPTQRRASLTAVIACIAVFGFTIGLTYPLLSLILIGQGVDSGLIGSNAAMSAFGILASSPFVPRLALRYGHLPVMLVALAAAALIVLAFRVWPNLWIWFLLRFLLGAAINVLFVLSETWINQIAVGAERGRIVGIYAAVLSAGLGAGPLLIPLTGTEGWAPFVVAALFILLAALPVLAMGATAPHLRDAAPASMFQFFRLAPLLLLGVAMFSVFDGVAFSLFPVYAIGHGHTAASAALMVGVLILGNVALQYPVGWFSDRAGRRAALIACAAAAVAGAVLVPLTIETILLWPVLFVWGGLTVGIYTVCLTSLGERFTGTQLVAGNAAFGFVWGLGGMVGPTVTGAAMDLVGREALPALIGLFAASLLVMIHLRQRKKGFSLGPENP